ncbi:MAG: methyltransferase domain-containing protein [Paracoccus sp. (in: a-proteobacteria)]|nr:methyltransferase domain-containing protein [Paracoccus sp. (in: a-proteobacteria)]
MPDYSEESSRKRGTERARALPVRLHIDPSLLQGAKILDLGCGRGESADALVEEYGAEVTGVDPYDRHTGGPFVGRFNYLKVPVEKLPEKYNGYFDFVQSYNVLEHIPDPIASLEKVNDLLRVGGRVFMSINLFRGASASHSNQDAGDWCHLLKEWQEIEAICRQKKARPPDHVNKLAFLEYVHHINRIGFDWICPAWFQRRDITEEFYRANIDKLQWYPKVDLNLNFMLVALVKTDRPVKTMNEYLWGEGGVASFVPEAG